MRNILLVLVILSKCAGGRSEMELPEKTTTDEDHTNGELWAVLVAGSSGWFNYRHQADVCHAYQILHQHTVPDDHIIVMMYDDIAHNLQNPHPGVVINRPNGTNVYKGVPKDYTGSDVTPENFLNILKGNTTAMADKGSGKVLKSTHNDRIFINLVDHGGPGVFAFPDDVLHARDLARTLVQLHYERKFKEMVLYVEACESGSMFKHLLPDNIKVYALSASGPHQPSFACYMDEELDTYLGDVFSVKWMEDTDREDIHKESLNYQFHLVHQEVTTSRVMQWGERDINREKLWKFMGEKNGLETNSIWHHQDETEGRLRTHDGAEGRPHPQEETKASFSQQEINETLQHKENEDRFGYREVKVERQEGEERKQSQGIFQSQKETEERVKAIKHPKKTLKAMKNRKKKTYVKKEFEMMEKTFSKLNVTSQGTLKGTDDDDPCLSSAIVSYDVPKAILTSRLERSKDDEKGQRQRELSTLYLNRMLVQAVMRRVLNEVTGSKDRVEQLLQSQERDITQWDCYDRSVDIFHSKCFNLGKNPYALRVLHNVVNLCEDGYTFDQFEAAVENVCNFHTFTGIN